MKFISIGIITDGSVPDASLVGMIERRFDIILPAHTIKTLDGSDCVSISWKKVHVRKDFESMELISFLQQNFRCSADLEMLGFDEGLKRHIPVISLIGSIASIASVISLYDYIRDWLGV